MAMNCKEFEEYLTLNLYGDLPPEQRAPFEAHLAGCANCQATREQVRRVHELLAQRPRLEPSPDFMVECRQALAEALDREQLGWHGLIREWFPSLQLPPRWAATRIAFTLSLVVFGFGLGWTLHPRTVSVMRPSERGNVTTSSLAGADLADMRINDISGVAPDPKTGDVRITMDAQRRVTLEGSLDDPKIQQVLVYAMKSYRNAGIRRDTLDALRGHADDPNIHQALIYAMRHDPNAGVRLEALKAVRNTTPGDDVHTALLEAIEHDANPGVRVAAVDALINPTGNEDFDAPTVRALEHLATADSNPYVRLKCANAMMKLEK